MVTLKYQVTHLVLAVEPVQKPSSHHHHHIIFILSACHHEENDDNDIDI